VLCFSFCLCCLRKSCDRHISVGFECRPLSAGEFSEDEILPCDTDSWDRGEPAPSLPLFVQSATKLATDHFARTCQVAHLLGRIIDHRDDHTFTGSLQFTTAMQLLRTLNSLLELLKEELESDHAGVLSVAYAMAFSAKTVLLNMYACTETNRRLNCAEETELQALALGQFHAMVDEIIRFGERLQLSQPASLATLSPLVCDCLYQGAATAAWYLNENGSEQMARSLDILTGFLRTIEKRWRVAGEYHPLQMRVVSILFVSLMTISRGLLSSSRCSGRTEPWVVRRVRPHWWSPCGRMSGEVRCIMAPHRKRGNRDGARAKGMGFPGVRRCSVILRSGFI
jgi:hypothetical protein